MTINEFIDTVGMAAVRLYPKYKILPSLCIAQALLESNKMDYRKGLKLSGLATECHNYFGMKWTKGCGCDYKEYKTAEQLKTGQYISIKAKFRKYKSLQDGIEGYMKFLDYPRYKNIKDVGADWKLAAALIRIDGWATSLSYTENLIKRIEYFNLWRYDDMARGKAPIVSQVKKPTLVPGMKDSDLGDNYILAWQNYLILWGYNCNRTSVYDEAMKQAVLKYQKDKGLTPDAIIGAKTWASIN